MKCAECGGKLAADNGKYGEKITNSTLYYCTAGGCGYMTRKNRQPKIHKQRKPLKEQTPLNI